MHNYYLGNQKYKAETLDPTVKMREPSQKANVVHPGTSSCNLVLINAKDYWVHLNGLYYSSFKHFVLVRYFYTYYFLKIIMTKSS